ncbi:ATP-binding cassette domain-containing protein, partial [Nostocoides japonicum]|uniref:ATP-binding cassette domain-containing protein n=1 Tax=Nostocoides japonicum TaxID=99481 RepID=UPI0012FA190B
PALLCVVPVATGDALGGLVDTVRALARAQAARDRLGALTSQPPAVADRGTRASGIPLGPQTAPAPPTIRLRGVSAEWHEGSTALAPVDLDLAPGSRTAIVGSNGSGKSTLLAVLARQLDPAEGSYTLDGVDATALDLEEVQSLVAVVDDEPHIFATTLRDNLRVAATDADDEAVEDALRAARLGPWLDALPLGLDTRLGAGGHGVSGGERARIALARALVSRRPVVLLDEPVAHLDHVTAVAVTRDVLATTRGRTVVLVSHRPEGLAEFDDVIDVTPANHARPRE